LTPARYAEHQARIAERRETLRSNLSGTLGRTGPFVWEVGCGHGHFLTAYAAAHSDRTCVGIDISADRISRANRKRERSRLANLHFVLADAEDFLAVMPASAVFDAIFILFPDPWPKRRHQKNRVVTPTFLAAIAAASAKGTLLCFRTDHEEYFLEAAAAVRGHADWIPSNDHVMPFEEPTVFQKRAPSHFTLVAARR
jgi:tRNA (guanine-N7-)-methyltransferase